MMVNGERQRNLHRPQSRDRGGGNDEAVLLRERAPLPLLLLVNQARKDVGSLLFPALGADVTEHDSTEEDPVETHDDEDVEICVPVTFVRWWVGAALRVAGETAPGRGRGVSQMLHFRKKVLEGT